ncbi:chromatin modification-related protein EAF7-like [Salvia splendens]|uniref:chromatin modification-related protein EAF7-like n=1 Tax=Salvia splendens TaxID=180675 RepID=UPI001C2777B6|nr:chromatin modification-related protein EAF7-like [Salvia splendens]
MAASEPVVPPVIKPKAVKRKLVLKGDQKGVRSKPQRVSQRCLGKWEASKAKPNTEADPVEILSEEERATPTKPGEKSLPTTDIKDTAVEAGEVSPTPSGQVGHEEQETNDIRTSGETNPTAQDKSSQQAEKEPEAEEEEDDGQEARYQAERKRKGKALLQRKPSGMKRRAVNIGVVLTEPAQGTPPSHREQSDSEYAVSEESESDSDTSMEDEEYNEQQLPDDHRELLHPPAGETPIQAMDGKAH